MSNDHILSFISLAMKAGKVKSGEFSTEEAVKKGKAHLVIIASDASDNTKKHFTDMCDYRKIPYRIYSDSVSLGRALGLEFRMSLAICDSGFAKSLEEKIEKQEAARRNTDGKNQDL